eukprot:CAMPEP_0198265136 /NCGR_PEP_ID=MMETSP1447-20131203/20438_1 /TAXON_ID=420782 /ORGANISM="Chaetoceros dichaeta, Strain CCMP1751" /LENGTH=176 /DNA_ID=CAMNT_0043954439 /DNA_START=11 /DNA_END=538 /DNA_ORIENTATION=+
MNNNDTNLDIFMEPLGHIGDADMKQSAANDGISGPMELDGQGMNEEDCSFMFEWLDSDDVLDVLPSEDGQPDCEESLRTKQKTNRKSKKRLCRSEEKRKRKSASRRKRRCSSTATGPNFEQANKPESRSNVPIGEGLLQASFNQAYQDTLSNLAITMKRSAFSRMRLNDYKFSLPG